MNAHVTPRYPRVPLKVMDGTMLLFELSREIDRVIAESNDREMITSAASLASYLHRNQLRMIRKGLPRTPYIEHPLRVALRLIRGGETDPHTIAAALLHDVVEDCAPEMVSMFAGGDTSAHHRDKEHDRAVALDWLRSAYSPEVADAVADVSNPLDEDISWLDHMGTITELRSLLIKGSDLVDNPGSLIHQYGHVKDSFIISKVIKYTPGVPLVASKLEHYTWHPGVTEMIESLGKVSASLAVLRGRYVARGEITD